MESQNSALQEVNIKLTNENLVLKNKVHELSQLNSLFRTMRVTTSMETLLKNTVETCHKAFGVERAFLFLLDKNSGNLIGKSVYPHSNEGKKVLSLQIPVSFDITNSSFSRVVVENDAVPLSTIKGLDKDVQDVLQELVSSKAVLVPLHLRDKDSQVEFDDCSQEDCPVRHVDDPDCWANKDNLKNRDEFYACLNCKLFPVNGILILDNTKSGEEFTAENIENIKLFTNHVALAVDDIQLHQEIRTLAIRDGLTSLYNHRHFQEVMGTEISRSKRYGRIFSLVFIDVDHFKKYNDSNGHQAGDEALRIIADILEDGIRPVDIVARYGGEEFVILLPETDKKGALVFIERKRKTVEECTFQGEESLPNKTLTCSFGVASFPEDSDQKENIIEVADKRLYKAKEQGRNKIISE